MASWRELPEDLAPEGRRLIIRMRQLKDRSGLSLTALGRRTSYSSSSWARYLNGQSRPPARAVQELAHECGDDPHRLLAMHSLAEESWPGTPAPGAPVPGAPAPGAPAPGAPVPGAPGAPMSGAPAPDGTAEPGDAPDPPEARGDASTSEDGTAPDGADHAPYAPPDTVTLPVSSVALPADGEHEPTSPGIGEEMPQQLVQDRDPSGGASSTAPATARRRTGRLVALAVAGAVAGAVLTVGALTLGSDVFGDDDPVAGADSETTSPATTTDGAQGAFPETGGEIYDCEVAEDDGLLWAGYSRSEEVVLQNGMASWDVVEAQCLLAHHDVSPGEVDGWYGPDTERAVQRFQEQHDLVVDGMVGPHTWGELRR